MNYRDIKDYNWCAINEDDEAIAFFISEEDCDLFIEMYNHRPENGHLSVRKGEYIDCDVSISVRGS